MAINITEINTTTGEIIIFVAPEPVYPVVDDTDDFLADLRQRLVNVQIIFFYIGLVVNTFHLIVLTRKSMRSSSVFILMIGITISDLIHMLILLFWDDVFVFGFPDWECTPPDTYFPSLMSVLRDPIEDILYRLSAWLGVLLATFRLLIISYALNGKYDSLSKPRVGWIAISITFFVCLLVFVPLSLQYKVGEYGTWRPSERCAKYFTKNYEKQEYGKVVIYDTSSEFFLVKVIFFLNGFSRTVPPILYPILTVLLIIQMKIATRRSRRANSSSSSPDRTTPLVILMTISFMIAEGPVGVFNALRIIDMADGNTSIFHNLSNIFVAFLTFNASLHCFICLSTSSQYRSAIRDMIPCWKQRQNVMINVTPTVS